jgi:hypothetical protein
VGLQISAAVVQGLSISPYLSIVLGVVLSIIFCIGAGLCRQYHRLLRRRSIQVVA